MVNTQRWILFGRLFMAAWILFPAPYLVAILASRVGAQELVIMFGWITWAIVWLWLWLRAIGRSHRAEVTGFIAMTLLLTTLTLVPHTPVSGTVVFIFLVAGCIFPLRQAVWALGFLVLLQVALLVVLLIDPATAVNSLINSVLVGSVVVAGRLFWQSYLQLLAAREEIGRLAVSEERLRFARDLHDLLGQSLAVIVLKSELLARQMPADADETVRQELRDVARVARKSLNDVREAVSGYHRPSLAGEIGNARTSLRAAGIAFVVEDTLGRVPPEQDGVLAWCLREAVTNVLKHSGAHKCVVQLSRENGEARLEIGDDGHGAVVLDGGTGIPGLRDRVELAGGKLNVQTAAGQGLRIEVVVPAGQYAPSELVTG